MRSFLTSFLGSPLLVVLLVVLLSLRVFGSQGEITPTAPKGSPSAAGDVAGESLVDHPLSEDDPALFRGQHEYVEKDRLRAGGHVAVRLSALRCSRDFGHCYNTIPKRLSKIQDFVVHAALPARCCE